jgi:predicted membrane channel-forming protein YqfA (hemolysin III family)
MKKIKEFFSPLNKGHHAGLTFWKWMFSMGRLGIISIFLTAIILLPIFEGPGPEWDPEWSFWGVEAFLTSIFIILVVSTLKFWSDIKR